MVYDSENKPHEAFEKRMNEVAEHVGKGAHFADGGAALLVARGLLAVAKEIYELRCMLGRVIDDLLGRLQDVARAERGRGRALRRLLARRCTGARCSRANEKEVTVKINPDSACHRCMHFVVCKHVEHVKALVEKLPRDRHAQLEHAMTIRTGRKTSDDPCIHAGILYTAVANVCNAYTAGPRLKKKEEP